MKGSVEDTELTSEKIKQIFLEYAKKIREEYAVPTENKKETAKTGTVINSR